MADQPRNNTNSRIASARRARVTRVPCAVIIASWAAMGCGVEGPGDPTPPAPNRPSAERIDSVDARCGDLPDCCVGHGARCGGGAECCPGSACVATADGYFRCAVPCAGAGDCPSGCCAPASPDGELVCAGALGCQPVTPPVTS